ncbi:MFS transporter [Terrarubrum flagellatum]|uniref:MFS transporter n=1 Tax=Terrirubrum flagellatum TaxID=2895980 RepID=UPI003144E775
MSIPATDALARRNARIFATAQALGGATHSIVIASGGLVGQYLAQNDALSTLPVSITQLGVALFTLPAAFLARRAGRRTASVAGMLVGAVCGALAAMAIIRGSFAMFCLSTFLIGFNVATIQQYRFAAADAATPAFKARAISWVMMGGVFAAVIGPQTAIWTRDLLAPIPFAGVFVGHIILALICALVLTRLTDLEPATASAAGSGPARPAGEIFRQPRLIAAIVCGLISYGLMSFAMTAAPLAIVACGYTPGEAWLGIQWHVLGMFGPSFFTGKFIDRYGKERVTAAGLLLLAASAAVALTGPTSLAHFWIALTLLGIGWNFAFIGATALVTDCYRPSERALVQSVNDFSVFGTVALASFASGQILNAGGWAVVNWIMYPALAVAAGALLISRVVRAKAAAAA